MSEILRSTSVERRKLEPSRVVTIGLLSLALTTACSNGGNDEFKGSHRELTAQEVATAQAKSRHDMKPAERYYFDYLDTGATQVRFGEDFGEVPSPTGGCLAGSAWDTSDPSRYNPGNRATQVYDQKKKILTVYLPDSATDPHKAAEFTGFDDVNHVLVPHNQAARDAISTFCTNLTIEPKS
jgi:hypothetical protein